LRADDFRRILSYNRLVLHAFFNTLEMLPWEMVSRNLEASHNSMKDVFVHILTVYDGWLNHTRVGETAGVPESELDESHFQSMDDIKRYMVHVETGVDKLMEELNDALLSSPIKVDWWEKDHTLSDALMQVTLEEAHHVGELIALLWRQDIEPPEMTWIGVNEAQAAH